ncbi:MAG: sigma-70 family RNA polymerase sigma factor [Clostridia bacterium]|nr:sigma-70 family RNA polymerase sigma factor [Clostridia bacterium]
MSNEVDRLKLRDRFVSEYLEKLFYFCLKKTGDAHEAEDLASGISLKVLSALEKEARIENFAAWVWKIAKNSYSSWAARKAIRREMFCPDDVSEYEVPSEDSPEDGLIREEELKTLRRELAFIASEYREITVAYYIKQKRISEISKTLSIPEGTVKTKLYRARKKLKEGLSMAREFGKRSYDPESIFFTASGNQPSGLPWSAVERKIPVNILCEANNNPSTSEELSIALGIALPYMEEEIGILERSDLLKKLDGGRYLTNFFIYPVDCQNEIYEILCKYCEDNRETVWDLGKASMSEAKKTVCRTDAVGDADAEMFFALRSFDAILDRSGTGIKSFKRRDGGNWGFCGFENGSVCRLDKVFFSKNGTGTVDSVSWCGYQADQKSDRFPNEKYKSVSGVPNCSSLTTLKLIDDGVEEKEMSPTDLENVKYLSDKGFVVLTDGKPRINAIVFNTDYHYADAGYLKEVYGRDEFKKVARATEKMRNDVRAIVEKYSNPYLKDDFDYYVNSMIFQTRAILAPLFKDSGLYKGSSSQFCAFYSK